MNCFEKYEIIRQYEISVNAPSINNRLKAKICKRIDVDYDYYTWSISHNYKPSEQAASVYYPSNISGNTFEEVYHSLFSYINGFKDIGVKKNEFF